MPEIIQELDETPVGKWGLRKRLTQDINEDGTIIYSVREYAPRPVPFCKEDRDKVETYVPARGIDLSEYELKSICEVLRKSLYHSRHNPDSTWTLDDFLNDIKNKENKAEDEPKWDENDNGDPVPGYEYSDELSVDIYVPIAVYGKNDNTVKKLNLVSWHNKPIDYDLREFTKKINSRGYEEFVPELDKGLTLSDYEAEVLCQGIETLFPEVLQKTGEYKEEITDDFFTSVPLNLSEQEIKLADKAIETTINVKFEDTISETNNGFSIGDRDSQIYFGYLGILKRKMDNNERMYDSEIYECVKIFYTVCEWTNDKEEREAFETLGAKLDDIIVKRNKLPSNETKAGFLKHLIANAGEFETASEILQLVYNELYYEPNTTPRETYLRNQIDELVKNMVETRFKNYPNFPDTYKENPGKKFIQLLIQSMDNSANSPFSEPQ